MSDTAQLFRRDYTVPWWLFWPACGLIALTGINGLHLVVEWLS